MKFLQRLSAFRAGEPTGLRASRQIHLQAQIQPHFLFNTLNTAIALVRQDPHRAEAVLLDLADLFRQVLADPHQPVTLAHELALTRRYLAIEQQRFGPRLRIDWSIGPHTGQARLPALVLQPLVENAVRHGVEPSPAGAQVCIATERCGPLVRVTIDNTVPGGPGPVGSGLALRNVRARLRLLHGSQARLLAGLDNARFRVRLELPA